MPEKLSTLLDRHRSAVSLLKTHTETHLPDLKLQDPTVLPDGTILDELFYLRYVLSSLGKEPLTNLEEVKSSKAMKNILANLSWRNDRTNPAKTLSKESEKNLLTKIPLIRTGALKNGTPTAVLPVRMVDFDWLQSNQKTAEKDILGFLVKTKEAIFRECDRKTREKGELVKSLTVYDLKELSFSSIYRLTKFFKIVQGQGKLFKQLFPQGTLCTVIVNSPGAWVIKNFGGSSKTKVMSVKELLSSFDAAKAVPTFLRGNFKWPSNDEDLFKIHCGQKVTSKSKGNKPGSKNLDGSSHEVEELELDFSKLPNFEGDFEKNGKIKELTALEREMLPMKKHRVFSIAVLEKNQKVNLFFSNLRKKDANLLVIIREENSMSRSAALVHPGFGWVSLQLNQPGEIFICYMDRTKLQNQTSSDSKFTVEGLDVNDLAIKMRAESKKMKSKAKKLLKFTKKTIKKHKKGTLSRSTGQVRIKKIDQVQDNALSLEAVHNKQFGMQFGQKTVDKSLMPENGKLLFRFEVTDAVVCGSYDGNKSFSELAKSSVTGFFNKDMKLKSEKKKLKYDGGKVGGNDDTADGSFVRNAAGILGMGW